jgi:FdhD protein
LGLQNCYFLAEVVQKLKFLNNSIVFRGVYMNGIQEQVVTRSLLRITPEGSERLEGRLIMEECYRLYINGVESMIFHCLPKDLEELALGHCRGLGLIRDLSQVKSLSVSQGGIRIQLPFKDVPKDQSSWTEPTVFSTRDVLRLYDQFEQCGELFRITGCVHGCAVADQHKILLFYEDLSRHNALKKLIGAMVKKDMGPEGKMIIFSGRLAADMVLTAAVSGIRFLVAPSATTAAAVDLAEQNGITLLAFVRGGVINVYTHPENITEV